MKSRKKPQPRIGPMDKPWSGRFRGATDPDVEAFTSSLEVDRRLYRHDIAGSIAHALQRRSATGSPSPENIERQIARWRQLL